MCRHDPQSSRYISRLKRPLPADGVAGSSSRYAASAAPHRRRPVDVDNVTPAAALISKPAIHHILALLGHPDLLTGKTVLTTIIPKTGPPTIKKAIRKLVPMH